jgi:hypothetical protein
MHLGQYPLLYRKQDNNATAKLDIKNILLLFF